MQTIHLPEALRDRDWARAGLVTLAMLLAAVTVFATAQARQLAEANARLDAVAQKAFYETCELTEGLAVNFRKLLVAGEAGQRQALLNEAALQAQGAMSNLALLPLQQDTVSATLKFINQAGDFSQALSEKLASGGSVTPEDRATLESLSEAAASFSVGLARLLDRYERGEAVFTEDIADDATLYPLTNPAGEYPVLLYDGPFSDGRTDGDYRTLEGLPEVTESQARAALAAFIGSQQPLAIVLTGEGNAPVACYEYEVRYGDYRMSAGVTKRGGQTLYLLCESDVEEVSLSPAEAVDAAEAFLISRGYGPAEMSYYSQFGGILTVNFAPVLNGVVLYPDLVKVQVSLRDGTVIGLEPAGYLMNHVDRTLALPALSASDAAQRLGTALTPVDARLCVIPQNGAEFLCYEVTATDGTSTFLAYIDAMTGVERELMEVVSDGEGAFVM